MLCKGAIKETRPRASFLPGQSILLHMFALPGAEYPPLFLPGQALFYKNRNPLKPFME